MASLAEFYVSSGFFWDNYTVVTCSHNLREVESSHPVYEVNCNGAVHKARLIGRDVDNDVAVLHVMDDEGTSFVHRKEVPTGLQVFVVGFPRSRCFSSKKPVVTMGIIGGKVDLRLSEVVLPRTFLLLDALASPGESGSPVLDHSGLLVGMVQAILTSRSEFATGHTFAIGVADLEEIVDRLKSEFGEDR